MNQYRFISTCERDRVIELTRQGRTAPQIAEQLKRSTRTVQRIRTAAGIVKTQATMPMTPQEIAWAQALLDDGASYNEVARTLGRNMKTIAERFKGCSKWTPRDGGELRQFQKNLIKRYGDRAEALIRELAA